MNLKKYDITSNQPIMRWDEALPLGNGALGCLIYGDEPLRLSLDSIDLWDTRPNPATLEEGFNFANLVKLVKSGDENDWKEYNRLFNDIFSGTPYPSKITAGRIELTFADGKAVSSKLSISNGLAEVYGKNGLQLQAFLSATDFVGVAKAYGDFSLNIHIPDYISGNVCNQSGIGRKDQDVSMRYPKAEVVNENGFTYYVQSTHTDFKYGIFVYRKPCKGYDELYFTVAKNTDGPDFVEQAKAKLLQMSKKGFDALFVPHEKWWKAYWNQSQISLGDKLFESVYYRSWYLFACTSRKGYYPMPIQGVWTADNDSLPPWKGDYHHDTNTELSYQAFLKANRLSEGEVFVDYLWNLRDTFKKFAKNFFGVDGILLPSSSTIDGKAMGGWAHYALSPTMTIWSVQSFDEYWLYTGDETFLRERAYPFLKEVGTAIFGLLEERNGKLYLPLSSSPEIHDASRQAYLTPNSNFDLALMIYLYKTLQGYATHLGDDKAAKEYAAILEKFDDIAVFNGKVIALSPDETLQESHRHFSHLMCLYPLHLINYDTPEHKRLYECTLYELERWGMGMWVGFSYGMCAQIYAMAEKGNSAYEKLRQFAYAFVADNGFHLNGDFKEYGFTTFHYRPFTLESSFGWCDALHEMLFQDHQGYVHLFPAIPLEWKDKKISFKKLRSIGGVLLSATLNKNVLENVVLETQKPQTVRLKNTFGVGQVCVDDGFTKRVAVDTDGFFIIELGKGKTKVYVEKNEK